MIHTGIDITVNLSVTHYRNVGIWVNRMGVCSGNSMYEITYHDIGQSSKPKNTCIK
jgi:hypothetical protein